MAWERVMEALLGSAADGRAQWRRGRTTELRSDPKPRELRPMWAASGL